MLGGIPLAKKILLLRVLFSRLGIVAGLSCLANAPAFSQHTYPGYSTRHKGLAGAGAGLYGVSIIGGNPAGNALLGTAYSIGFGALMPVREYSFHGGPAQLPNTIGLLPPSLEINDAFFPVFNMGGNWQLSAKSAIGASLYTAGEGVSDYSAMVFFDQKAEITGINLDRSYGEITYSRRIAAGHQLGISALLAYQQLEARNLNELRRFGVSRTAGAPFGARRDSGFGAGFKTGYLGRFGKRLTLGLSYRSRTYMAELEGFSGLYAAGGKLDAPATFTAGIAYFLNEDWTFLADYQRIRYSITHSAGNVVNPQNLFPVVLRLNGPPPEFAPVSTGNESGLGWKDGNVVKFAFEFSGADRWTFRGAYSYAKKPFPDSEPATSGIRQASIENRLALGFSRPIRRFGYTLNFAIQLAFDRWSAAPDATPPGRENMRRLGFEVGFSF